ncbi:hypothetical protein FPV67DRAFT_174120 [Lyophyllum atratum]|nr:hypothetical protein FPV67DRAFT_174120 [Lyophyllum atratum]
MSYSTHREAVMDEPTQNSGNEKTLSVLNNTIAVIGTIRTVIPIEIAKGVLSTVADILTVVKDSIQNRDDFLDLVQQCRRVASILKQAHPETQMTENGINKAISNLEISIVSIQKTVKEKTQDPRGKRLFNVVIDKDNIAGWQKKLDNSLQLFIAEMALATNSALAIRNMGLSAEEVFPDVLPSPPRIFVGRTELLDQVTLALLEGEHVALIGSGGMGKSSIAAAVLQSDAISKKFNDRRYFVRFDDIKATHITPGTFLDRVSKALGIQRSNVDPRMLISRHLFANETLLVLDNGESFQDAQAGDPDSRIASTVIEFSNIPGVTILVTTRTATLPFDCLPIQVKPLEERNACDAFMKVYPGFADPKVLPKLLATLDFHPLSINLLAHAAAQNKWSPKDLIKSWDHEKVGLLEQGGGKFQSLAVTIGLSLESPSISALRDSALGDAVLRILQTIAFLPHGLYEDHITDLIPRMPRQTLEAAVTILCRHSLIYREGGFLRMLAPIRLHMSGPDNAGIFPAVAQSVTSDLRTCYFTRVKCYRDNLEWLRVEDVNAEHMIYLALSSSKPKTIAKLYHGVVPAFLNFLLSHGKARATTLRAVILDVTIYPRPQIGFWKNFREGFWYNLHFGMRRTCILQLALLAVGAGRTEEARELASKVASFIQPGNLTLSEIRFTRLSQSTIGMAYFASGRLNDAEAILRALLSVPLSFRLKSDIALECAVTFALLRIIALRGREDTATDFLKKARRDLKKLGSVTTAQEHLQFREMLVFLYHHGGDVELEDAKAFCQDIIHSKSSSADTLRTNASLLLIAVALLQKDKIQARAYLEQAQKQKFESSSHLSTLAVCTASATENFDEARGLINRAIAIDSISGHMLGSIRNLCMAADIELYAGEYATARKLYLKVIEDCDVSSQLMSAAQAKRALGEIATLEKDSDGAKQRFAEARSLCETMDIPPENLDIDITRRFGFPGRFVGWQHFLTTDGNAPLSDHTA